MSRLLRIGHPGLGAAALVAVLAAAGLAQAQNRPPSRISEDLPESDFLFGPPRGSVAVRGTLLVPSEGSDLFDFVRRLLTIDKGAFRSPAFSTEVGVVVAPRIEVVGGFDLARKTVFSEYRDFVDNNRLPIEQESRLRQNSLTASLRVALTPRGRSVGRFAWIPARVQPYAGAGGGVVFWRFQQAGDFVDFQDLRVFSDVFDAGGTSPSAHVLGGADVLIYRRLMLSTEGRYVWAKGDLKADFVGFEPLDLSGFRFSAGISIVF